MQTHLFASSRRDFQEDISRLATLLPPDIVSSATLFAIGAVDDDTALPRYIASTGELDDGQITQLKSAVAELGADDLELQIGLAHVPPTNSIATADELPASFFGVSDTDLGAADKARVPIAEALKQIMEAKASGINYPEKFWTGDLREAYEVFVKRLGRAPMDDKGSYLTPNDVSRAAEDRPEAIDAQTWKQVQDHLSRELKLFAFAADWFSVRGYLHGLFTDQRLFNGDFVQQMNDTYLKLDDSKAVSIGFDVCMSLAIRAIGTIKGYGIGLSAAISALWTVTKGVLPDPNAPIKAAIADMQNKVAAIFNESLTALSKADKALGNDWGLLDRFGNLLEQGVLVWPRDLTELRSAQSRAFQYVALQSTVHLLSGQHRISLLDIGVVDVQVKVKGKQNGKWSGMHYLTHSVYSKGGACGVGKGWYLREVYLGYSVVTAGSKAMQRQDASAKLQNKLFGHSIHDPADPQFALPQGFLLFPSNKLRNGWNLPQLHFSG